MATGFVQRFKGKITVGAGGFWVRGNPVYGAMSQQSLSTSSTAFVVSTISGNYTTIASGTNAYIYRLGLPAYAGDVNVIQITSVSTLGVFFTASVDATVTINGSSVNTTFKSTQASVIQLVATSTANWAITGVYPSTLGVLTLSTST